MARRKKPASDHPPAIVSENVARSARETLRSYTVGALPLLNQFLQRMRLEDFLRATFPPEDRRTKLSPVKALLVLLRNLLISREPIYGMGEWAARQAADALGLTAEELARLNDDGVGRALDRLFAADVPALVLVEALLERQLRQAMQRNDIEALPLYPEGRACRWPTARRVIDLFESVQRHTLQHHRQPPEILVTDLTRLQRRLLKLLGLTAKNYGR